MKTVESILVVEDEPKLMVGVQKILESAGYRVLTAGDGIEALGLLELEPVDLILADIAMPRMNGYQLFERVTENPHWVAIPFLFLTARAMDSDIRYGQQLGVDGYLIKPFEPKDVLAAVRGRLRRAQMLAASSPHPVARPNLASHITDLGRLQLDCSQHRVWMDGKPVKLSVREFRLLECLADHANGIVTQQALVQVTHGLETDRVDAGRLLRPLIRSVRRKLGYSAGDMGCIQSVRGVGYLLVPPHDGDPVSDLSQEQRR